VFWNETYHDDVRKTRVQKKQQKFDWNQFVWYTQKITPQKNSNPYSLFIGHKNTRSDNNDQANYFALSQKKVIEKFEKKTADGGSEMKFPTNFSNTEISDYPWL